MRVGVTETGSRRMVQGWKPWLDLVQAAVTFFFGRPPSRPFFFAGDMPQSGEVVALFAEPDAVA